MPTLPVPSLTVKITSGWFAIRITMGWLTTGVVPVFATCTMRRPGLNVGRFSCVAPAGTSRLILTFNAADCAPAVCGEIAESVPMKRVNPASAANGFRDLRSRRKARCPACCDRVNLDRLCARIFLKIRGMGKTPFPTMRRIPTLPLSLGQNGDLRSLPKVDLRSPRFTQ